jgi:hypothetical protein
MNRSKKNIALAAGVAGALALGATSLSAAPVMSNAAALKNATPNDVVQVRSRGGRAAAAAGIGFAAGALVGAAASSHAFAYSDPYWYGHGPVFAGNGFCHWNDPWCNGGVGVTFAAPAPVVVEPNIYAAPAPVVRRRVVADPVLVPGPTIFAGPQPLVGRCLSGSCSIPLNPGLGTIHGANAVD